jgi:hypothetical protein
MPTFREWIDALLTDYEIEVVSSAKLIKDIRKKQNARIREFLKKGKSPPHMKRHLKRVSLFDPSRKLSIKPFNLLHSIGRITTPPIPNLVDFSSTWAIIRYIWAFEPMASGTAAPLMLSGMAREIDFHQKALLSYQMGIGFAHYLMVNYFGTSNPIDVGIALQTPSWDIDQQYSTSPDYLFYDDPLVSIFVVECKGNQTSYGEALNQLRRGTEQVPSIIFNDGRQVPLLVIATCMLDDRTCVYVIDPPEDDEEQEPGFIGDSEKARRMTPNRWRIVDDEWFRRDVSLLGRAKMLAFAGAEIEAMDQLPFSVPERRRRLIRREARLETLGTNYGEFQGVSEGVITRDGFKIEVYRGLLADLREKFSESVKSKSEKVKWGLEPIEVPHSYLEHFKQSGYITHHVELANATKMQSLCRDGTILEFTIKK